MKKFISSFLVFSILALSMPLTAKERKGADLIIQKMDGQLVRGELIAVKQDSLLLLERESEADVTVDIDEISVIRHVKKLKLLQGAGLGLLIGGGAGAGLAAIAVNWDSTSWALFGVIMMGGLGAVLGLLIGGIAGGLAGITKTFQFDGKSDSDIQEILEKLRKKARVRISQ